MAQGIRKDCMGRHDHTDVLEGSVPCALVGPAVDIVQPRQGATLDGWDLRRDDGVLLEAQRHRRGQKPDQLSTSVLELYNVTARVDIPCLPGIVPARPGSAEWH